MGRNRGLPATPLTKRLDVMANHKSALKRARQNIKLRTRNRALRSTLRTHLKTYRALLSAKNGSEAATQYPKMQKVIDKMVTKGILHRNAAARYKSRLATALLKVQAA